MKAAYVQYTTRSVPNYEFHNTTIDLRHELIYYFVARKSLVMAH